MIKYDSIRRYAPQEENPNQANIRRNISLLGKYFGGVEETDLNWIRMVTSLVTMSLKKNEIILIESALHSLIRSSKSPLEQELASLLIHKLSRFSKFVRGETKAPAKKAAKKRKK